VGSGSPNAGVIMACSEATRSLDQSSELSMSRNPALLAIWCASFSISNGERHPMAAKAPPIEESNLGALGTVVVGGTAPNMVLEVAFLPNSAPLLRAAHVASTLSAMTFARRRMFVASKLVSFASVRLPICGHPQRLKSWTTLRLAA